MKTDKQLKLDVLGKEEEAVENLPELPKGWKWMRLGSIAKIIMGQSPPSKTYNSDGEGFPFYQGKADFGTIYPTPRKWCIKPLKIALGNDILISVRAPVGPVNLCKEQSCVGRGLAAIRVGDVADYSYVFFYLMSKEPELAEMGKGSTFGAIKRDDLVGLWIPVPLDKREQTCIVRKIEEILSRVEQAKKIHDEASKILETIRPAVLDRAFKAEL